MQQTIMKLATSSKGNVSYDYDNDYLVIKTKDRNYDHSIELNDVIVDLDSQDNIVGIRIFYPTKYLKLTKSSIKQIENCFLDISSEGKTLLVRLRFATTKAEQTTLHDIQREMLIA